MEQRRFVKYYRVDANFRFEWMPPERDFVITNFLESPSSIVELQNWNDYVSRVSSLFVYNGMYSLY